MEKEYGIRLRALEPEDVDFLYAWENDMKLWVISDTLVPFSKDHLKKYIAASDLDLYQSKQLRLIIDQEIIETNQINEPMGLIDLYDFDPYHNRAGVGILLHQKYRGQGIASEALRMFIDYCFNQLGINQLYCTIASDNMPSQKLFKSHNFKMTGVREQWRKRGASYVDEQFYQLIRPK